MFKSDGFNQAPSTSTYSQNLNNKDPRHVLSKQEEFNTSRFTNNQQTLMGQGVAE